MKTNLLKSIFISLILVLGVSNAWAWNVEEGKVYYFKPSTVWKSDNARFAIAFGSGDNTYAWQSCVAVSGETDTYYVTSPGNYDWMIFVRMNPANNTNDWSNKWNESQRVQPNNNYNKFELKANWATDFNWYRFAPPMKSVTISNDGSTVYGGDGTSNNPYQIKKGATISVQASATSSVPNDPQTKYYKFYKKENSGTRSAIGNESTTTTSSFTASSTVGTKYEVDVEARNEYYSTYGTKATSSKLYFVTIEPIYAILGSFNDWTHSANTWDLSDQGSNNWKATFHLEQGNHTFKVVHNSSYYGKNSTTITRSSATASSLSTSDDNINLTADYAGNYTFTFNSSTKKLTVTYPTIYTVTYSQTPAAAADAPTTNPPVASGNKVLSGTSINFSAKDAKNGYTWKGWYDNDEGTGDALSTTKTYTCTINADTEIYAVYTLNTYRVAIVADPAEAAETLTSSPQTVGVEPVAISTTAKFTYKFDKWKATDGITITDTNNPSTSITATTAGTVTAHFTKMQPTTVYLKPNEQWKKNDARFAIHYWHDGQPAGWVDMTDVGCNRDYFVGVIPAGYTDFLFARMDPNNLENKWNAGIDWNKTGNLKVPTDGKDLFTLPSSGDHEWNGATTTWGTYTPPTYDVKINITGKGAIVINGQTYEGTSEGKTTLKIEDVVVNTAFNINSITAAERWDYTSHGTIEIGSNGQEQLKVEGSYEICGPTTINLEFIQKYCLVTFLPNPPKSVIYPEQIGSQEVRKGDKIVQPAVVDLDGYLFGGWYPNGSEYTDANKFDFDTPVEQDLVLCARWVPYEQCIFFKNNLNWDNIYVYTFKGDVWGNDGKGVYPANRYEYGKMTQIGYTDVYYYILTQPDGFNHIAFSDYDMHDYTPFWGYNAIYRGDRSDKMQLFIPEEDQTPTRANESTTEYYNKGIWMKYNSTESGYKWSSDKNSWSTDINPFTAPNKGGYSFTTKVSLEGGQEYLFKINNIKNDWFGHTGKMTQDDCTDWWFKTEEDNATIEPNATGEYLFTIYLGDGKVMVSLEYPLGIGDYRLAYQDNTANSFHPGHYIRKRSTGTHRDTTSFFVLHDKAPVILLQECIDIKPETGEVTWQTLKEYTSCPVNKTTVYNFVLLQEEGNDANLATSETHLYTGDFYIRTDDAPGGWDYFRQNSNKMTFSSYAQQNENFDHYFCKWVHKDKNVRYTVANDYSYCISDTLYADDIIGGTYGDIEKLPANANVRFMWDSRNNSIGRAYIAGSSNQADRFLVVEGKDNNLKDAAGNNLMEGQHNTNRFGLHANEEILKDMGNWIYQVDVKANKDAWIKLTALYDGTTQYFKGAADGANAYIRMLTSDATDTYKIRLIYDFKINQLIIAWLVEDNTITEENTVLGADMMIIRHNQERAKQLNFDPNNRSLEGVGKAYAVLTFDKYFLNNRTYPTADGKGGGNVLPAAQQQSQYARALYWVSFPFNVKLSEVSGFGEYGDYWILEYYDGADRAKNGLWVDTDTYWKYITNPDYTIQAGQGYVLSLNLNKMGYESAVFTNTAEVSLFFPSTGPLTTITGELPTAVEVPAHECTIERENGIHKIYDSHWNVIGVPGFADIENVEVGDHLFVQDSLYFYYEYLPQTNEYRTKRANNKADFQTMCSYMIQYHGGINWSTKTFNGPAEIAARRTGDMPSQYDLRLELAIDDQLHDQTFLLLDEDKRATAEYDVNLDLTKIMNKNASIYTLAGEQRITLSGNTLPMGKATVPVGVRVDAAGEYTFRMPDGTDGISVTLVDNVTGTHTDMLMDEYTVKLDAGTIENRFYLVVDPDRTATSVENVGEEAKGEEAKGQIKKFLIDGKLFIRTADGIFDAKGQRL